MKTPDLDDLLDQLEEARETGQELSIEELCRDCPEMIGPLRERWQAVNRFDDHFATHRESTEEVHRKLAAMPENMHGRRLVMQTELHVERIHDSGGLGEVYEATDEGLARKLAIKMLQAERQHASNLEDFKRETQIIGRLNHPGIVAILGWGETIEGRPFYAMPFVDRGNLRESAAAYHTAHPTRVQETDKEFRDLLTRLVSVCKAIAYAHSRGIVHRDLKPENVMLGKYGETVVIDWGCATRVDRHARFKLDGEQTLQLKGVDTSSTGGMTLRYASPEQLHGEKRVGPESDIYSLGAILYRLLTGKSPLEDVPPEQVRNLAMAGNIDPPEALKAGIPRALSAICRKAMAIEPSQRYETALALADDLERFLSDASVSVCQDGIGTRLARFVRRNRTASGLLLGTLLIGSALLSIALAGQSVSALQAEASAKDRLRLAATMAASIGGFEVDRRISLLEHEAQNPQLVAAMTAIQANPEDQALWDKAQNLMYEFRDELTASGIATESMFITDAKGMQIARAPKTDSIGENFAFRNYFHGLDADLDPTSADYLQQPPPPANGVVVSNAYVSTNTDKNGEYPIKTALSVAIMSEPVDGQPQIVGRLGMSVRVNDLGIFERLDNISADAVLVDLRNYPWGSSTARGLILDRKRNGRGETFTVPDSQFANEKAVQDAMPRLNEESIERLLAMVQSDAEADLIPDFYDPQVNSVKQDAASATVPIPFRENLQTGWAVVFIEAEP